MYNLADQSYLKQPRFMSPEVVEATLSKVREHALTHNLKDVSLIFHGGEPLLASHEFYRDFVASARRVLEPEVKARFSLQTNGTLITVEWLELFLELGIGFGISLDGPPEINDVHRLDHQGKGSYRRIAESIRMIRSDERYTKLGRKVLTVINVNSDPLVVYRHFRELGFKEVDFLFPDGTYDLLPPDVTVNGADTPYADWLIPIFDEWFNDPDASFVVRSFSNIIRLMLGSDRSTDNIGGRKGSVVVIETDGGIEPVSALKACGEGFTKAGLNVLSSLVDEVYDAPLFNEYLSGQDALAEQCYQCPVVSVCGGGYLPHRYKAENGFDNPSVFCRDLLKLVKHIQANVVDALPADFCREAGVASLESASYAMSSLH